MAATVFPFKSVFVTGGSGFVGRYLLAALQNWLPKDARFTAPGRSLDLCDTRAIRAAIAHAQPDLIFHLAAQSSVGQSVEAAAETWAVNVSGTLSLAQAIATEAPTAVVAFASSSEVYGEAFNLGLANENTALMPKSVYARTKRAAEEILIDTLAPSNQLFIFRPTNHTGPGQSTRFVLPAFAAQIAAIEAGRQPPTMKVGSLIAKRDVLDVRDVVDAYGAALAKPSIHRVNTLNIASGRVVPIGFLLESLFALTAVPITVELDSARMRPSDILCAAVNADQINARTGWRPVRPLEVTILDVLDWFRNGRH